MEEKHCVTCGKIIPEERIKAFPKRNIVTCSKSCSLRNKTWLNNPENKKKRLEYGRRYREKMRKQK